MEDRAWVVAVVVGGGGVWIWGARPQTPGASQEEFIKTHEAKYESRIPSGWGESCLVGVYAACWGVQAMRGRNPF